MNKVLMRPLFKDAYLKKEKKLEVKKFKVGGLSEVERRNLLLTPITSALLQARKAPGESELGALARTLGQGMAQVPTVASQISDLEGDEEEEDKFEFVADEDLPPELQGKGAYQKNLTTGKFEKVGREAETKQKDTFRTLTAEEAQNRFGDAFNKESIYQINENTDELKVFNKKTGTTVTTNVGPKETGYQKKFGEGRGERDAEKLAKAEQAFTNSFALDQTLDTLDALMALPDSDLKTGALGEFRLGAQKLLSEFGIETDLSGASVAPAELLRTVGGRLTIEGLQGFKGAISNKELTFVQGINPGLSMSKDGIKLQASLMRRANELNKRYYEEILGPFVQKNNSLKGTLNGKTLLELEGEFHTKNPLIDKSIQDRLNSYSYKIDKEFAGNLQTINGDRYIEIGGKVYKLKDNIKFEG